MIAFLSPALRAGRILSPADLLLLGLPWAERAPRHFVPANALLSDYVYQFKPWRDLVIDAFRHGRLPLWDPHNHAGAPLLGNGISAALFPPTLLFLAMPEAPAMLLGAALRLFIPAWSTYAFARLLGGTPAGAALSGVSFGLCGFLVAFLLWPQVNVAMWLPLLFLCTERAMRAPTRRVVAGLAAVVCVQFLGGHPETSLHILTAAVAYAAWRGAAMRRDGVSWRVLASRLGTVALGIAIGTAAAAIQLVPLAESILHSAAFAERVAAAPPVFSLHRPELLWALGWVCPHCFGSHLRGSFPLGEYFGLPNFNDLAGGVAGLTALAIALVGIRFGALRGAGVFFAGLAIVAFGTVHGIPPIVNLVEALPLFGIAANMRMSLLWAFAVAMLAGRGADLVGAAREAGTKRPLARWWPYVALGLLGAGTAVRVTLYTRLPDVPRFVLGPALVPLAWLTALGLVLKVLPHLRRSRRLGPWALVALAALELIVFGRGYNPAIRSRFHYPSHPAIDFLRGQPGPFRILTLGRSPTAFPPNTNAVYGLEEVRGYNAQDRATYLRYLDATGPYARPYRHFPTLLFANFDSRLVDALNVRYVLSDRTLDHPKLALVKPGRLKVYENRDALPRAFLVFRTLVVDGEARVEAALRTTDVGAVAVLPAPAPVLSGPADPDATAEIVAYRPEHVEVETRSGRAAMLVLADAHYPGWTASVDSIPARIFPTDLIFRGVALDAGTHRVVFRYVPLSVSLGAAVTLVGLGTLVWLAARPGPGSRRPGETYFRRASAKAATSPSPM